MLIHVEANLCLSVNLCLVLIFVPCDVGVGTVFGVEVEIGAGGGGTDDLAGDRGGVGTVAGTFAALSNAGV